MPQNSEVTVVDVRMPFWSLVVLLVKLSVAAIPAMFILSFMGALFWGIFGAVFGGMHDGFGPR